MKGFKDYVAPTIRTIYADVEDVVCASQVDVYSDDSYADHWTDTSLKK